VKPLAWLAEIAPISALVSPTIAAGENAPTCAAVNTAIALVVIEATCALFSAGICPVVSRGTPRGGSGATIASDTPLICMIDITRPSLVLSPERPQSGTTVVL
jgi:hypothetical protein